jgi:hypothetical protein
MMLKTILSKWWFWVAAGVGGLVIIVVFVWIVGSMNNSGKTDNNVPSTNTTKTTTQEILPKTTFANGLGSWYEHVWYKPASSGGEVTTGSDGVTFKAVQPNSRSGIMLDLNKNVSGYKKVTITAEVVAGQQTLSGTGLNGREAPVAIAISYLDENGTEHNLLGENPKAAGQMFWRGFYYLNPTGGSGMVNGVKVTQNQSYTFTFDLMTLSPKPKVIRFVGVEGAGWKDREGSVRSISITGE